jgi:hypothetical protein
MVTSQVKELLQSFETDSKAHKNKYNDFLAYVYVTFDKKISSSKADKIIDKYIKMRKSVLSYIVTNEKSIIKQLNK